MALCIVQTVASLLRFLQILTDKGVNFSLAANNVHRLVRLVSELSSNMPCPSDQRQRTSWTLRGYFAIGYYNRIYKISMQSFSNLTNCNLMSLYKDSRYLMGHVSEKYRTSKLDQKPSVPPLAQKRTYYVTVGT